MAAFISFDCIPLSSRFFAMLAKAERNCEAQERQELSALSGQDFVAKMSWRE